MRSIALALSIMFLPAFARAQSVDIRVNLPAILPPMVVVQPGVQVVPEVQEEVFFHDGWYWVRRDHRWYRARDHRGGWILVPERRVPPRLVAIPAGHYRNWKAEKEERKEERRREKEERRDERREEREEHHREHGHGHGHDD